jgi:hypothetical protein
MTRDPNTPVVFFVVIRQFGWPRKKKINELEERFDQFVADVVTCSERVPHPHQPTIRQSWSKLWYTQTMKSSFKPSDIKKGLQTYGLLAASCIPFPNTVDCGFER